MTSTSTDQITHNPQAAVATDWCQIGEGLLQSDFAHHQTVKDILAESGVPGHLALRAPLAVAASLLEYPLLLTERRPLRIAVLGAEIQDVGVDGRLFGLVPHALASSSIQLEVELVGPQLKPGLKVSRIGDAVLPPAKIHRKTCGDWWASTPRGQRPDLMFMFHPGMEQHASQWMKSTELPRLLASGIPLIVFSYDLDEAHRDAHILESFGAQIVVPPKLFESSTPSLPHHAVNPLHSFAGATFTVSGFQKKPVHRAKVEVAKIRTLSSVITRVFQTEGVLVQHGDAFRPCQITRNGESCAVLHIITDIYFDPRTTEIFEAKDGNELACSRTLLAPNVGALLPHIKSDLGRSMIAAEIYSWF